MLHCVEPTYEKETQYLEMCRDYIAAEDENYTYASLEEVRKKIASDIRYAYGEIPANRVRAFSYWFLRDDRIVGTCRMRPRLNDAFRIEGGNIGYDVSPRFRNQGIGTGILKWCANRAFEMGLAEILITCDDDNVGSCRIIEKNDGMLADTIVSPRTGRLVRRYIIRKQADGREEPVAYSV